MYMRRKTLLALAVRVRPLLAKAGTAGMTAGQIGRELWPAETPLEAARKAGLVLWMMRDKGECRRWEYLGATRHKLTEAGYAALLREGAQRGA